MGIAWVPMIAQMGGTLLHILWCYLFVLKANMGVRGLGLATALTNLIIFVMITVYAHCVPKIKETLFCPNAQTFSGWGEYLRFGVPATVMLCAEWWAFEILILLSGIIGVQEQAVLVIQFTIMCMTYMINLGIQEASATLIGN